jgi:hypothetical protein
MLDGTSHRSSDASRFHLRCDRTSTFHTTTSTIHLAFARTTPLSTRYSIRTLHIPQSFSTRATRLAHGPHAPYPLRFEVLETAPGTLKEKQHSYYVGGPARARTHTSDECGKWPSQRGTATSQWGRYAVAAELYTACRWWPVAAAELESDC